MSGLEEIKSVVDVMPRASKGDAMKAAFELYDRVSRGDRLALRCVAELLGGVATSDDAQQTRNVLVWVNEHGPIVQERAG